MEVRAVEVAGLGARASTMIDYEAVLGLDLKASHTLTLFGVTGVTARDFEA